jgi:hypothetical protein
MNWLIESALKMARMSDAEIDDISAKLPAFGRLAAALKKSEPTLSQAAPLIDQLFTELKQEWPDIVAVTPTVEELIEFANSKGV